uniref:Uncharacterized protein n=1 Tax=Acrobeloides nanus TaxID=290746 RepID=A0A914EDC8_9BILA
MKSVKIVLSEKERKLQEFKVGEWYHANLENDCFVKADEEFPTRIRQNFLEIQAPLILFTESSNEQEQGFDDIQQAKRRINRQEYSIGYVPGLGRVGVFLKKPMKKQEFHRVWVKKVDFSSIPKTVKDIYEKHEIHWIVDDQEPKKMELIDLLTFRHINLATGIVVHKDDEKIQIWNEKFGLLDKFIDEENLIQVGAWVKFSHIEDFTGHSIATNLMEIKKPMGFEKMIDGHNFCLQIALYHIQIQPETQHYYIKNLGTLDDPKNFLPNLNKISGDYKQVAIVSFDKKAKIWKVEEFIGPKIQSKVCFKGPVPVSYNHMKK